MLFKVGLADKDHFILYVPYVTAGIFFSSSPGTLRRGGTPNSLSIYTDLLFPYLLIPLPSFWWPFISWMREQSLFPFTSWGSRKVGIKITFFWIWQVFVLLEAPKFNLVRREQVNLKTLNHASIPRSVCFMYFFRFFSCLNWWLSRRTSWAPLTSRLLPPPHRPKGSKCLTI